MTYYLESSLSIMNIFMSVVKVFLYQNMGFRRFLRFWFLGNKVAFTKVSQNGEVFQDFKHQMYRSR